MAVLWSLQTYQVIAFKSNITLNLACLIAFDKKKSLLSSAASWLKALVEWGTVDILLHILNRSCSREIRQIRP